MVTVRSRPGTPAKENEVASEHTKRLWQALAHDCAATALRQFAESILPDCKTLADVAMALDFTATQLERSAISKRAEANELNAEIHPDAPEEEVNPH
jgi:hypothetical protein